MFRTLLVPSVVVGSLLWSCLGSLASTTTDDSAKGVMELTQESLAESVKKRPHFVMFFAPWCGHCKKLYPAWQQLNDMMKSQEDRAMDVGIARVDCTTQTALCSEHEVTGYPTLKFFKGSEEGVRYKGARDFDSLLTFIEEQQGRPIEAEKQVDASKPVALTTATFKKITSKGHHFVKFYAPWCGHCKHLEPIWEQLANVFSKTPLVTIAKVDCTEEKDLCSEYGIKGYPTLLWFTDGEQVGERYSGERTLSALQQFTTVMGGKPAKPLDDTPQVPAPSKLPTAVTPLTTETFAANILQDVTLVKFFAPWCGHCKKMAGAYEELGAKFSNEGSITIAEVDCTQHDSKEICSQEKIKGFPTILLYRAGVRIGSYEGDRSTADMAQYVTSMLSHDEL